MESLSCHASVRGTSTGVGSPGHGLHMGVTLAPQEGSSGPAFLNPLYVHILLLVSPDAVSGIEQTHLPTGKGDEWLWVPEGSECPKWPRDPTEVQE